ncbi:MAG: ABC transporter ATP-binding protein/permease [Caldilinea sp.]|nr:ABC transporter ATP-binding protein [Caldilineaceae bacterium]MCO5211963.1 ABC transporter ATP-binding protein/permease [Caldilinea sp.]MCW5841801.1 ABC transporter ATP-binding protein [Caldilinea sp.]
MPRALRLVWDAAPLWTLASTAILVVQGVLPVVTVYLTRNVVNALVAIVQSNGDPAVLAPAVTTVALMGLVMLTNGVLGSINGYIRAALSERVRDQMHGLIHVKALSLDMQFFESPTYYDQLQRASIDAIDRPMGLLDSISRLLQNTITLVAMAGVLLTFAWWLPIVLMLGTLPALWVALRSTVAFHRWRLSNTINERRLIYYNRALIHDEAAPEIRLFDLGGHFTEAYNTLRHRLRDERLRLVRNQTLGQIGAVLAGLLAMAASLLWIAWQALQGLYNLGDMAMLFQAMAQGQQLMQSLLNGMGEIYRNLLFLDDLFTFLALEPTTRDPDEPAATPGPLHVGVELKNITFQYPYSDRVALSNFNLAIPAGQIVAIVGENGAGKSTLLKLLCRFYDPQAGSITWDGVDLRALRQQELRRQISVLFQNPMPYHESVAANIGFGDIGRRPGLAEIEEAARGAGAHVVIDKLPEGYETVLGKWFGYTQLSTGEWQRLALARAFVRQAALVILDEPTSAMDSWAENEWMGRFRDLVEGRTAVIITHRFTTAMQADIIHVMHEGQIVESGTHADLVRQGGRYAGSWRQQMREAGLDPSPSAAVAA